MDVFCLNGDNNIWLILYWECLWDDMNVGKGCVLGPCGISRLAGKYVKVAWALGCVCGDV